MAIHIEAAITSTATRTAAIATPGRAEQRRGQERAALGWERLDCGRRIPEVVGRFRGQHRNAQHPAGVQDAPATTASASTTAVAAPPPPIGRPGETPYPQPRGLRAPPQPPTGLLTEPRINSVHSAASPSPCPRC